MIIVSKNDQARQKLVEKLSAQDLKLTPLKRGDSALLIEGKLSADDKQALANMEEVLAIEELKEKFVRASRQVHPEDSVIDVAGVKVGGGHFAMIGGPCAIESLDQLRETARYVKAAGANMLRGGAFKPRTSPYSFQGMGQEGLRLLHQVGQEFNLPTVAEVMEISQIELFDQEGVDVFQIGARNAQNFDLLKAVGKTKRPVLLKRGIAGTIDEWLMSAEYIMSEGNPNVMLCERGIRTYETATRNTQDLSAVPLVHQLSHLPVVVDPSHAAGRRDIIEDMALAGVAAGADGLIIETHIKPEEAVSDGPQSLYPDQYQAMTKKVWQLHSFMQGLNA
ncbi:3-deoxy-7-phosphoheptulonate synthase [Aerococcus urinaehominis]|uniref:3-deoxy-7-phosphoheptulonate synthase n=1 Tax=Aerococcus urinaehominis TaxID=128944 RepID=A0A0X8FJV9_9LACT|nr:3-deoxy-7-phosphoheptulonate synthase [Aerococcus urinaehominis]AMB98658.1 3-deoxy-7-phosphoheptulonate synthase [Aerococcus urinaehominis]SDL97352.1 3-deoxy-D-arabinoheptulosonate-7-phosphate synthase [Aerococcus urinaehominis]